MGKNVKIKGLDEVSPGVFRKGDIEIRCVQVNQEKQQFDCYVHGRLKVQRPNAKLAQAWLDDFLKIQAERVQAEQEALEKESEASEDGADD